ncbi:hypothetical protein L204_106367 [Cryptococcus depauperatus]
MSIASSESPTRSNGVAVKTGKQTRWNTGEKLWARCRDPAAHTCKRGRTTLQSRDELLVQGQLSFNNLFSTSQNNYQATLTERNSNMS